MFSSPRTCHRVRSSLVRFGDLCNLYNCSRRRSCLRRCPAGENGCTLSPGTTHAHSAGLPANAEPHSLLSVPLERSSNGSEPLQAYLSSSLPRPQASPPPTSTNLLASFSRSSPPVQYSALLLCELDRSRTHPVVACRRSPPHQSRAELDPRASHGRAEVQQPAVQEVSGTRGACTTEEQAPRISRSRGRLYRSLGKTR